LRLVSIAFVPGAQLSLGNFLLQAAQVVQPKFSRYAGVVLQFTGSNLANLTPANLFRSLLVVGSPKIAGVWDESGNRNATRNP